jgi:2-aminoadipate transaminase
MVAAFRRELPEVSMPIPHGGYYLWLTLPDGLDGDEVASAALANGVTVLSGSKFFARTDAVHPKHHIRSAFSHATHEEIDEGVRRMAHALSTTRR